MDGTGTSSRAVSRAGALLPTPPWRHRRVDLAVALVAVVATVLERVLVLPLPGDGGSGAATSAALLLAVVVGASLAWRSRAPVASYAVGTAALAVESLAVQASTVSPYVNLAAVVSLAWYGSARRALWGPPLALAGIAAWFARAELPAVIPVTVVLVWFAGWGFAYQESRRRETDARERSRRQHEAVRDERTRIARELHDVVGHALSLMLVQVGAARTVLEQRPGTARDLLLATERTGADAMGELDRVLGLLRDDAAEAGPGLPDLDRLVARLGEAGLRVHLERGPGVAAHHTPSTDLAVYRVAQESLTNALRHGRAGAARVRLARQGDELVLEVVDDGVGPPAGWEPGRGLLGVAERVALLGGSVEHGAAAQDGGFRVAVRLPVGTPP